MQRSYLKKLLFVGAVLLQGAAPALHGIAWREVATGMYSVLGVVREFFTTGIVRPIRENQRTAAIYATAGGLSMAFIGSAYWYWWVYQPRCAEELRLAEEKKSAEQEQERLKKIAEEQRKNEQKKIDEARQKEEQKNEDLRVETLWNQLKQAVVDFKAERVIEILKDSTIAGYVRAGKLCDASTNQNLFDYLFYFERQGTVVPEQHRANKNLIFEKLIDAGATLVKGDCSNYPFFLSVKLNDSAILRRMLELERTKKISAIDRDMLDLRGFGMLHLAVYCCVSRKTTQDTESFGNIIQLLEDNGWSVDAKVRGSGDYNQCTVLDMIAKFTSRGVGDPSEHVRVGSDALEDDFIKKYLPKYYKKQCEAQQKLLTDFVHCIAYCKEKEMSEYFEHETIVAWVKSGKPLLENLEGDFALTPLEIAIQTASPKGEGLQIGLRSIEKLLNAGAPLEHNNRHRGTPLMYAAFLGHVEAFKRLLQRGANAGVVRAHDGLNTLQVAIDRCLIANPLLISQSLTIDLVESIEKLRQPYYAILDLLMDPQLPKKQRCDVYQKVKTSCPGYLLTRNYSGLSACDMVKNYSDGTFPNISNNDRHYVANLSTIIVKRFKQLEKQ